VTRGDAVRGDAVRGGEPCVGTHRGGGVWHAFMAPRLMTVSRGLRRQDDAPGGNNHNQARSVRRSLTARFVPENSKRKQCIEFYYCTTMRNSALRALCVACGCARTRSAQITEITERLTLTPYDCATWVAATRSYRSAD